VRERALDHDEPLVRAAAARLLGAWADAAARERLEGRLADRHWLVRANAARALALIGDAAARPALLGALGEKEPAAWIALADAFAAFPGRSAEATQRLLERLDDRRWQVRLTAIEALERAGTAEAVEALIERFSRENGRLEHAVHRALRALTGDDLGPRADTWRRWWEERKTAFGGPPPAPDAPAGPATDGRYAEPTTGRPDQDEPHYYGRRVFSRSVCFVLDTSKSMELEMRVHAEDVGELGGLQPEGTRASIAKKALEDALGRLDPRTRFSLVLFGSDVTTWKDGLVPAAPPNVADALSLLRRTRPEGETNFHGALESALGAGGRADRPPALGDVADTVFFLTDGRPTRGEITAMPELISWFGELNRFAKVTLHVIALGDLNIDLPSLERLAAAGGGDLLHVRER
jgi:hypothetical protein